MAKPSASPATASYDAEVMASRGGVELGDSVLYKGQRSLVRGFTMKSSSTQHVDLEDEESGKRMTVPLDLVERRGRAAPKGPTSE